MTSFEISELVKEVKVLLDRNSTNNALVANGDVETLQQDALIEPRICEAVQLIEQNAPLTFLGDAEIMVVGDTGVYTFENPILRLLGIRGEGWKRVPRMITTEDEEYSWQHSEFGVKANKERPVCVVVEGGGNVQLEFIPKPTTANIMYIPFPQVADGSIDICVACKNAIIYAAASLVSSAMGDANGASTLLGMAYQMAGIPTTQSQNQ